MWFETFQWLHNHIFRTTSYGNTYPLWQFFNVTGEKRSKLALEEVSGFIGRAVLLRQGQIVGDTTTEELEEQGLSLLDYVKSTYHYRADRVGRALDTMTEEG
jgi:hypothetical protein